MSRSSKWILVSMASFVFIYVVFGPGGSLGFWISIITGWFFSRPAGQSVDADESRQVAQELIGQIRETPDENKSNESEAARVRREAKEAKTKAMSSGVPELISELYHSYICHYPTWIKETPRDAIPKSITIAKEIKMGKNRREGVFIRMKECDYKFLYESNFVDLPDGDSSSYGDLELFINDEKILHINESIEHGEWSSDHRPFSVDAFLPGSWIDDFKELRGEIKNIEEQRKIAEFENPQEIEKLKKNFGIN